MNVSISSKTISRDKAVDAAADWKINFSFSRRDLNEYTIRWLGLDQEWFHNSTVSEIGAVFVTDSWLEWSEDEPFDVAKSDIETALGTAMTMANLADIEKQLYDPADGIKNTTKCVVNDALHGVDRVWDDYLANHERIMSQGKEKVRNQFIQFDKQLRAFKQEHPDGIPRD